MSGRREVVGSRRWVVAVAGVALLSGGGVSSAAGRVGAVRDDVASVYSASVQRLRAGDPALYAKLAGPLAQVRAGMAEATALQRLAGGDGGVAVAKEATGFQARTLGVRMVAPPAPEHGSLTEAVAELADRRGVVLTAGELAPIREVDRVGGPVRAALVRTVDAFMGFEDATRLAYRNADRAGLAALRDGTAAGVLSPAGGVGALRAVGVDLGPVFAARNRLLDTVPALREALGGSARGGSAEEPAATTVDICPVLAIDFAGAVDSYPTDCVLIVDAGGGDTYTNNAGGSHLIGSGCVSPPADAGAAAAVIDLGGDDDYVSGRDCGTNGGGNLGAGFLYDAGGSDTYTAGSGGTNGGGNLGAGFLLDAGGSDTYTAGFLGTNGGGGTGSAGFLHDAGVETDTYTAWGSGTNGGGYVAGVGFLHDAGGNDTYTARGQGTNGGGYTGSGFLHDAGGSDTYTAGDIGTNGGGSTGGSGFLHDAGAGTGTTDSYTAGDRGTNGGGSIGSAGFLYDDGGRCSYTAGVSGSAVNGVNGGGDAGHGLLLDVDTHQLGDTYRDSQGGTGTDKTVALKGIAGSQLDWIVDP